MAIVMSATQVMVIVMSVRRSSLLSCQHVGYRYCHVSHVGHGYCHVRYVGRVRGNHLKAADYFGNLLNDLCLAFESCMNLGDRV